MRKIEERIFFTLSLLAALFGCAMLFFIIIEVGVKAISSLTPYFLLTPESETPRIGMGIANAIVGSVFLAVISTIMATPLALGTAIYLQRYAKPGKITNGIRFFIEVLSGTPSIVLGIFGLLVLVYYLKPITGGYSLISGSIALTILIVPVIERSIEEAVHTVPHDLEEGSYALGATKWETTRFITIPSALAGIVTGIILGLGRAAEESAVVILTAGYTQFMPEFTFRPNDKLLFNTKIYPFQDLIGSLPYSVYHAYENSNVIPLSNGFAAAFILIMIILFINIIAKMVFWYGSRSLKKSHPVISSLKKTIFNSEKKNKKLGEKRFSFSKEPIKNLNSSTKDGPSDYFQLTRPIHPPWTSALTQPVQPASPVPSIDSGENPHILSSVHHDPDMPLDGSILPDDTEEQPIEVDQLYGMNTDSHGAGCEAVPLPELFEDKPPAMLESGRVRVPGFGGEYEPDVLLAEPGDDLLLMEEPSLTAQPKPTAHPYENWPLMAKNQWENTDV